MGRRLIFVSPHRARFRTPFPSRPSALLQCFIDSGHYSHVVVVNRLRPDRALGVLAGARKDGTRIARLGPLWALTKSITADRTSAGRAAGVAVDLVEHPWPSGRCEAAVLARLVARIAAGGPTTLWVSDPMAAQVFGSIRKRPGLTTAFDCYDAWDLSPLIRGGRRLGAVRRGYAAAARADVVFANTEAMRARLAAGGAGRALLLPNACGEVVSAAAAPEPYLAYVGRIHERFDVALTLAVADAIERSGIEEATLRIAGPVEREPEGWARLAGHPRVRLVGALPSAQAISFIGASRGLLVPHTPSDYTRSQDAMKAWDALAAGVPVVSTSVPPATVWPRGLAEIADDPDGFARAALAALTGQPAGGRQARLDHARTNRWQDRAREAIEVLDGVAADAGASARPAAAVSNA